MRGIWRYGAEPESGDKRDLVAAVDGVNLVPDIDGLALAADGETGGHLVASVQGNSTFAVFALPEVKLPPRWRPSANGRFKPSPSGGSRATTVRFKLK